MAHAETCPVCGGKGVVMGIGETGTQPTQKCHGCCGRGWVEVSDAPPIVQMDMGRVGIKPSDIK